jgi:hypothetical protein
VTCSVEGCQNPVRSRGFCRAHYQKWRTYGDPNKQLHARPGVAMKFFLETVLTYEGDECLQWPFWRNNYGYGGLRYDGKDQLVSRLVCLQLYGSPPTPEHHAAHSCGNGENGCVNPHHLRWATRSGNEQDKIEHGTSNRGERQGSAILSKDDVISIRQDNSGLSQTELGAIYGVDQSTISNIVTRKRWGWLD